MQRVCDLDFHQHVFLLLTLAQISMNSKGYYSLQIIVSTNFHFIRSLHD